MEVSSPAYATKQIVFQGEISAVFDWVPDSIPDGSGGMMLDPLDTPPDKVILKEWCATDYEVIAMSPPGSNTISASLNNGLGFPFTEVNHVPIDDDENPTPWGQKQTGYSRGTRYKILEAGISELVVTCSPSLNLSVTSTSFTASASLWYWPTILVPKINVAGDTRFADGYKFLTGQQIEASVTVPELAIQTGSHLWSATGVNWFKNFLHSNTNGGPVFLTGTEKKLPVLKFYAATGGNCKITCSLKLVLPTEPEGEVSFDGGLPDLMLNARPTKALMPTSVQGNFQVGEVQLGPSSLGFGFGLGGNQDSPQGQFWPGLGVTVPQPFGQVGEVCLVQLITAKRDCWRNAPQGKPTHFQNDNYGLEALDAKFPYPYGQKLEWDASIVSNCWDSPFQSVDWDPNDQGGNAWYKATASDSFRVWMMYKPTSKDGRPTTWVPVARDQSGWSWSGSAELQNGDWSLTSSPEPSKLSFGPPLDTWPQWTRFSPSPIQFHPVN